MERQRLEQNATHYREQRDVGANAKRHHQDGDDGKTRGTTKRAQTKAQIACEGSKPVPGPDGASLFTNKSRIAKGAQGRVASLFFRNATFPLLLFFQFEVGTQLPFQVCICLLDLPPFHVSSPRRRATRRAPQLRPSASTAILRLEAASCLYQSTGSI